MLISARRLDWLPLDRPAAALLGAFLTVALGVLTPKEALRAIDGPTIVLLFGVMGMGSFLALDGFFDWAEQRLVRGQPSKRRLLFIIVVASGALSALITNDAVCVLGAPVVVALIRRHRLPPVPYLLALATSANTGSVATLVGNPQNMLCARLGGLHYGEHLLLMAPVAVVGLLINFAVLAWIFRRELHHTAPGLAGTKAHTLTETHGAQTETHAITETHEGPPPLRARMTLGVLALTAVAFTLGMDLAWTTIGGFVVLMLLHRRETQELWPKIDWSLLLFFAGLFVVVAALQESGAPAWFFERFPLSGVADSGLTALASVFLLGSNVVSNVPFILLMTEPMRGLPEPKLAWELLAMASTFAGNLTLLGSVANLIVAQAARPVGGLGFFTYLRAGLPIAVLTTLAGVAWLKLAT